jgi:hypothetical protein
MPADRRARAEDFDEQAVVEHLKREKAVEPESLACGCPGTHLQTFLRTISCEEADRPTTAISVSSALDTGPSRSLVPPTRRFYRGASLLVRRTAFPWRIRRSTGIFSMDAWS